MIHEDIDFTRYMARLLILRGVMLLSFTLFILYVLSIMTTEQMNQPVLGMLFASALIFSLHPIHALKTKTRIHAKQMLIQIVLDITLLFALLFFTGGYANPLISLFLLPLLVAGLTLPRLHAWGIGLLTILAYTLLMRFYLPLFGMHDDSMISHEFKLHLLGMWLTFVVSVILLISVIVRMSEQRRERDQQLADWQQRSIRQRAMLALGAQAASDAHELGTPLNTLLLLNGELLAGNLNPTHRKHVDVMQQQLLHCRHVLGRLSQRAHTLSNSSIEQTSILELFEHAVAQWRNLRPGVHVHLSHPDEQAAPLMITDPMLEQSLFILLDNAADAGATDIQADLCWDSTHAILTVSDNGSGFIDSLLGMIGSEAISTKPHGKGLGLYLVRFVLEQMHGSVRFGNQSQGGAQVVLQWPIHKEVKAS